MDNKRFLIAYVTTSLSLVALIVGINYYIDIYGLFRGKKDRKVYINERTSKYLFSYRYIPENFDGLIIGPSLSDNLNPQALLPLRVYNASLMGANISELNYLVDNIVQRGHIRFAILCLSPYLTKDHGSKSADFTRKQYYGALGSTNLLRTYLLYFIRKYNLAPYRYSPNVYNSAGWNNFELESHGLDPKDTIAQRVARKEFDSTAIDPVAYQDLGYTLSTLHAHHVSVLAYFTPIPYQLYTLNIQNNQAFVDSISRLFTPGDILLDLNDGKYSQMTGDYHNFIDHGHLSASGQSFVLHIVDSVITRLR
jgi:hypothetical protein